MNASDSAQARPVAAVLPLSSGSPIATTLPTATLVRELNPPPPATTLIAKAVSGDNRIDPLLDDASYRFNDGAAVGSATTVTYSFPSVKPATYTGDNALDWQPFSDEQKAATRAVLDLLQKQTQLTFQEVAESDTVTGTMRFSNNTQSTSSGYAFFPNSNRNDIDSDTFIAKTYSAPVIQGNYNWMTLVHEIGHAVGLNHPGNYNAGETKNVDAVGNFLSASEDAFFYSVMSYRQSAQGIQDTWFMPYDMLALRYLYGKKDYAAGDTVYSYTDDSGKSVSNVVDDGGSDTFDFSALSAGVTVNLTPGAYSSVGKAPSGDAALANLTTSFDATIERVIGSAAADTILGNAANNVITGGGGDDVINGAAGADVAVYAGPRSAYTLTLGSGGATVASSAEGTDTLAEIERLQFADTKLAIDLNGNAGKVAKLLGIVFGTAALTNKQYVGIGLSFLDTGTSYEQLAALAVGAAGASTPPAVVNLLWTNLFGSAPTADQAAPYVSLLNGSMSVGALTVLGADLDINTNHINLAGLSSTGLEYGP